MSEKDIKQALKCCIDGECSECPLRASTNCGEEFVMRYALDLINRQQAEIERLNAEMKVIDEGLDNISKKLDRIVYIKAKIPTADVAEVKHGYWEDMGEHFANCSNCGTIFEALPTMFAFKSNNIFCRHCGAKMDGERETK